MSHNLKIRSPNTVIGKSVLIAQIFSGLFGVFPGGYNTTTVIDGHVRPRKPTEIVIETDHIQIPIRFLGPL